MMREGWGVWESVFTPRECEELIEALDLHAPTRGGQRNMLNHPAVIGLAHDPRIRAIVNELLSLEAVAVRGIAFDKSLDENWALAMHQDTKIALLERVETAGFSGWSLKDGVVHAQPPTEVLARQIAVRLHLDPCEADCGPVHVIPNSHRQGLLRGEQVRALAISASVALTGGVGLIAVFRSLLVHGSPRMTRPARKRTLHLEFCDAPLPDGLAWRWAV